jgi:hypothetical protein
MSDSSENESPPMAKPVAPAEGVLYDERLRDIERTVHERKMARADMILGIAKRKIRSAQQLYEERLRDEDV